MSQKEINNCTCGSEHEHSCNCGGEHEHEHECSCGCGEHEPIIVELEDEKGNVVKCQVVDGFVFEENEYALVQNPNDESVYLFKVVGEDEQGELVVPEDEEFNKATAYYEKMLESEK